MSGETDIQTDIYTVRHIYRQISCEWRGRQADRHTDKQTGSGEIQTNRQGVERYRQTDSEWRDIQTYKLRLEERREEAWLTTIC